MIYLRHSYYEPVWYKIIINWLMVFLAIIGVDFQYFSLSFIVHTQVTQNSYLMGI